MHAAHHSVGRRALLPLICLAMSVLTGILAWPALQAPLRDAGAVAADADIRLLVLAGLCFAAASAPCALTWRYAIGAGGGRLGTVDACTRYGVGSLVNSLAPARLGEVVRAVLMLEALPAGGRGGFLRCLGSVQLARLLVLATLALASVTPVALAALPALAFLRPRTLRFLGLSFLAPAMRVCAVGVVLAALGSPSPARAALLIVPALDLASVFALTPANVGLAGAAVALALHAVGLPASEAIRTGIVVHGVETVAGLSYGLASAVYCLGWFGMRRRWGYPARLSPVRA
jgi:hypothetical protein